MDVEDLKCCGNCKHFEVSGGMSMMIKKDMNKRTDKIIKLVQQLR